MKKFVIWSQEHTLAAGVISLVATVIMVAFLSSDLMPSGGVWGKFFVLLFVIILVLIDIFVF